MSRLGTTEAKSPWGEDAGLYEIDLQGAHGIVHACSEAIREHIEYLDDADDDLSYNLRWTECQAELQFIDSRGGELYAIIKVGITNV